MPVYDEVDRGAALHMRQAHGWILAVTVTALPFIALLALNTFIVLAIYRQGTGAQRLFS
jgi:hypothetical protein